MSSQANPVHVVGQRSLLALLGLALILGIVLTALSFGHVPEYGDSREYLRLAGTLEVDAYRGFAYPLLLALLNSLPGLAGDLTFATSRSVAGARAGFLVLQSVQFLACAASLAYFLRAVVEPVALSAGSRRLNGWSFFFLLGLLLFDPLVAHFNLAVLTDGLALSASLVFCAALSDFGLGAGRQRLLGLLLFGAFLLAAGLRTEKALVLAGTTLVALASWLWLCRGESEWTFTRRRALHAAGIVLAGVLAVLAVQGSMKGELGRWSITESILHQRVIFPHLVEVYDELPADVRSHASLDDARLYDGHIRDARKVVDRIAGDREQLRRILTEEIAAVVWRKRWGSTILDVLGDTAENVLATPSFYARFLYQTGLDDKAALRQVRTDATTWTASRLMQDRPRMTMLHLGWSLLVALSCAGFLLARLHGRGAADGAASARTRLALLVPTGAFIVLNALTFALVADLTHVRYALLAHVALLMLVYRVVLGRVADRPFVHQVP